MEIENIIRDIRDLIHDVKTYESNASEDKKDAVRILNNIVGGQEEIPQAYEIVCDELVNASQALDRAMDRFGDIEAHLLLLIERIEREALSHKIQSR